MYQQQYISIVGRIIAKQADELKDRHSGIVRSILDRGKINKYEARD